jgi:hypothetical protein
LAIEQLIDWAIDRVGLSGSREQQGVSDDAHAWETGKVQRHDQSPSRQSLIGKSLNRSITQSWQ